MNLLAALLLFQAGPVADATAPAEEEIVVEARVARLTLTLGRDPQGQVYCSPARSSGDPALDDFACRDLARCIKRKPQPAAVVNACMAERKRGLAKRWLKRKGRG